MLPNFLKVLYVPGYFILDGLMEFKSSWNQNGQFLLLWKVIHKISLTLVSIKALFRLKKKFLNQIDVCLHSGNDTAVDAVDGNVPSADGEDVLGLSADSLSRLRSPSVMEVREKGNEKLKEELAKAQRVRH